VSAVVRYGGPDVELVRMVWGDLAAQTLEIQGRLRWMGTRRRSGRGGRAPQGRRPLGVPRGSRRPPEQLRPVLPPAITR